MYIALKLFRDFKKGEDFDQLKEYVDTKNEDIGAHKWFIICGTEMDFDVLRRTGKLYGDFEVVYDPFNVGKQSLRTFTDHSSFTRMFGGKR
jgi:hypothetical protein